jgi:hypothetical protein
VLTTDARLTDARAPTTGSPNYIQNQNAGVQNASFNITGNGVIGGNLLLQNSTLVPAGLSLEGANTLINFGMNSGREGAFDPTRPGYWLRADLRVGSEGIHVFRKSAFNGAETELVTIDSSGNLRTTGTFIGDGSGLTNVTPQTTANLANVSLLRWDMLAAKTFTAGTTPTAIAFDGANMWIVNGVASGTITKVRVSDGTTLGTFAVGTNPNSIAFDGQWR